jgi:tetratricopeptide (TPR) repeat protein
MRCTLGRALLFAIIAVIGFSASSSYAQMPSGLPKGRIIERVVCQEDPAQSYALYLPSNYSSDNEWPILYCFDFVGDGKLPAARFMEAAERYGYIIAGSNNSKNGVVKFSLDAFKAVWADTHARFSINDDRVYTGGFSGGARIASLIASFYRVEGVIACGAGFQVGLTPSKKTVFTFFATVGSDDFNFPEMKGLEKTLNKKGVVNRLVEFDGWHVWAPADLCNTALGWMEIQAIKKNKRAKDEALIERLFTQWLEEAVALEKNDKLYDAFLRFESVAADFKGLRDVSAVEKMAAGLKETEKVKRAIKQESDQAIKQKELEDEIWSYADMLDDPDAQVTAIGRLKERIAALRKDFEAREPSDRRRVVRRALTHLFEVFYERGTIRHANNYPLAIRYLEIAVEINPTDPRASYRLACMYSMKSEKKKALTALKAAVEKGFANVGQLESNTELEPIRKDPDFQSILEKLKLPH